MLEVLFGTKTVKKVLLFLFVNGKCYGSEVHKALKTPLTPIQKVLARLEKGGLLTSHFEGKTKLYQFNQAFPLLSELELLLKKAYTLLSIQEKKQYSFAHKEGLLPINQVKENAAILLDCWQKLGKVKELNFQAKTKSDEKNGWGGNGKAEVHISKENEKTLIFTEKGSWKNKSDKEIDFSNAFRWTLDTQVGVLSLEHLRLGINNPVFLFNLAPTENGTLSSVDSHLCGDDIYFGQLVWDLLSLRLSFRVIGPKKNEEIDYYYTI
jgi:hypothetical protein